MKSKRLWIILGGVIIVLAIAAFVGYRAIAGRQAAAAQFEVGEASRITAVTSVQSSGPVAAVQSGSVFWKATGIVGTVNVAAGDSVKAGDVLMMLDPASAPQNVILSQADLVSAQKALDELLHPTDLALANARKAVADAQDAYDKAQKDLRSVENPAGEGLYNAVADAQLAMQTAQNNLQLAHTTADAVQITTTENNKNAAGIRLGRAQAEYDDCLKISCGERDQRERSLTFAQNDYQTALDAYLTAKLKYETSLANQTDSTDKAQNKYEDAVANLNAALAGPDANKLAIAQAKVAVTQAALAEAQDKLNKLLNGADPKDIASAQARVQAAQGTADSMMIKAPFDGDVLVVTYQPGDAVAQTQAAVGLANRSKLHVDVTVDESEVSLIQLGDAATVTLDSLPDLTLNGTVSFISGIGDTVQGLVKYTVRVELAEADPRVLLGMTANANIITDVNEGALAVPLDAVQLDALGEFVNRVKADGAIERVEVKSGEVQGDQVVVIGALEPGDKVQIVEPKPAQSGSPFGG